MRYQTYNEQQTRQLGKRLARQFHGGEVIAVTGQLGAGKTILIKGIAEGLGIKQTLTSPTFLLMRPYPLPRHRSGISQLVHLDCYRLKKPEELTAIGAKEYFGDPKSLVVIEWADKVKKLLPKKVTSINFTFGNGDQRFIEMR